MATVSDIGMINILNNAHYSKRKFGCVGCLQVKVLALAMEKRIPRIFTGIMLLRDLTIGVADW